MTSTAEEMEQITNSYVVKFSASFHLCIIVSKLWHASSYAVRNVLISMLKFEGVFL